MYTTRHPSGSRLSARTDAALLRRVDRIVPVLERARRADPLARAGARFTRSRAISYLLDLALEVVEQREAARKAATPEEVAATSETLTPLRAAEQPERSGFPALSGSPTHLRAPGTPRSPCPTLACRARTPIPT